MSGLVDREEWEEPLPSEDQAPPAPPGAVRPLSPIANEAQQRADAVRWSCSLFGRDFETAVARYAETLLEELVERFAEEKRSGERKAVLADLLRSEKARVLSMCSPHCDGGPLKDLVFAMRLACDRADGALLRGDAAAMLRALDDLARFRV